jgi:hypothetical protein
VTKNEELLHFQEQVLHELERRDKTLATITPMEGGAESAGDFVEPLDDEPARTSKRPLWMSRNPGLAIEIIKDIINFQLESFQNSQNFKAASQFIAQNPEMLTNRIVAHIQYVFEIKELQGMIPGMNHIYLFVQESRNFFTALRQLFGLADAQNSVIISEALRRLSYGKDSSGTNV